MTEETLLKKLKDALLGMDEEQTVETANECIDSGIEPSKVLHTMADAMIEVGIQFNERKLFLPQVIMAANIMEKANKVPIAALGESESANAGKIVIGTIEGDIHDLGKNIVAAMLKTAGFKVIDAGKDVSAKKLLETAVAEDADIIACSALMSSTMPYLKDVVELRNSMGYEDRFKVMMGGAPVNQQYADESGADAYAEDAMDAVKAAKELVAA